MGLKSHAGAQKKSSEIQKKEHKITMDWGQVLVIAGSNLAIFLSMMGTSVMAYLHMDKKIDENRKETNEILKSIQAEIKDFHSRMYALEQKKVK